MNIELSPNALLSAVGAATKQHDAAITKRERLHSLRVIFTRLDWARERLEPEDQIIIEDIAARIWDELVMESAIIAPTDLDLGQELERLKLVHHVESEAYDGYGHYQWRGGYQSSYR